MFSDIRAKIVGLTINLLKSAKRNVVIGLLDAQLMTAFLVRPLSLTNNAGPVTRRGTVQYEHFAYQFCTLFAGQPSLFVLTPYDLPSMHNESFHSAGHSYEV